MDGKRRALQMHANDNVAVVLSPVGAGDRVEILQGDRAVGEVSATMTIPAYHKVALTRLTQGMDVLKYGEIIGRMAVEAEAGAHIHVRELKGVTLE